MLLYDLHKYNKMIDSLSLSLTVSTEYTILFHETKTSTELERIWIVQFTAPDGKPNSTVMTTHNSGDENSNATITWSPNYVGVETAKSYAKAVVIATQIGRLAEGLPDTDAKIINQVIATFDGVTQIKIAETDPRMQ